jgi:hypothetical protein
MHVELTALGRLKYGSASGVAREKFFEMEIAIGKLI